MPCPLGALCPYPRRFRHLLSGFAPASQPSCLRLPWTSNAPCRFGFSCSALHRSCAAANTASADFCPPIATPLGLASPRADEQTSRGKARDFPPIYPPHLRSPGPGGIGFRVLWPSRPPDVRLLCGSCSSGQGFAYSFLPTLPRDNAVAVRLGVPATKAPRGLAPPSHFPVRFRSPVDSAVPGAARHARRTTRKGGIRLDTAPHSCGSTNQMNWFVSSPFGRTGGN